MTPTQPEAAASRILALAIDFAGEAIPWLTNEREVPEEKAAYDKALSRLESALRAELARPQEVAAVGDIDAALLKLSAETHKEVDDAIHSLQNLEGSAPMPVQWWSIVSMALYRASLIGAARRVPVALPAEPVGHFIENFGEAGRWQQSKTEMQGITRPLYATPPGGAGGEVGAMEDSCPDMPSEFSEGQWWIRELDAWREQPGRTPNQYRSVAVVHHLLKSIAKYVTTTAEQGDAKDAARLDWLDSQGTSYGFQDMHEGNRWMIDGPFSNVRNALDAAILASKATAAGEGK